MAWQVSYRGLIDAASSVDVDGIDDFVSWLCILVCLVLILILPRRREQEAPIWRKRKSSKERCQGFVGIKTGILHSRGPVSVESIVRFRRRLHWHDGRKR